MAELTVTLPDGSPARARPPAPPAPTRPPRSARAWRRPRWRSGWRGRPATSRAPLADGEAIEIVTAKSDGALDLIRHDAAHVMARRSASSVPGTRVSIGPPIENGFYYDFEFPEGVVGLRGRPRADRGADARAHRRRRGLRAHRRPRRRGDRALPRRGPALQGRADRGPDPRRGRRDRLALPQRALHRPLPRARTRPRPGGSRRSSSTRSPAPTGAATRPARC